MVNPSDRSNSRDRILIVESDPTVSDLIGRQALQAVGYQVQVATDAASAIARALQWSPDLILVDLNLPGLSGKDLLVALASQGVQTPMIILAARGMEADVIQAFRLGASDYLPLPAREAEVVNAVNRVLQQVHDRRERDRLAQQLQQANHDLQSRVRELTTIFALGKAMTSVTEQSVLLEKILDSAVRITQADLGWFLLRDDTEKPFAIVAEQNLPPTLGVRLNQPWDDGISSLVAMSGEVLAIYGEPLKRFKISFLGLAALIVPIKAQKKVIGLLVMMRRQPAPFSPSEQHLLEALADYASISLVNARLFRAVEERARSLQKMAEASQISDKIHDELTRLVKKSLTGPLRAAQLSLEQLARDPLARWRPEQRQQLSSVQDQLLLSQQIVDAAAPLNRPKEISEWGPVDLVDQIHAALRRLQPFAQRSGVLLSPDVPGGVVGVPADPMLVGQVLEGVISNAIKFSDTGGTVLVRLEKSETNTAHLVISNTGRILDAREAVKALDEQKAASPPLASGAGRFGGLGIRLSLVKEIVTQLNGKIWIDSQATKGTALHIQLPLAR